MTALRTRRSRVVASLLVGAAALTLNATAAGAVDAPPSLGLPGAISNGSSVSLDNHGGDMTCSDDGVTGVNDTAGATDVTLGSPYTGTFTAHQVVTYGANGASAISGTFQISGSGASVDGTFGAASLTYDPVGADWPLPAVPTSYRTSGCGSYEVEVPYTAIITLPTGERFQDAGWAYTYSFGFNRVEFFSAPGIVTTPAPPALPTSKAQCMNGGWKSFPKFKNQGDCVSYVATGGKKG